MNFGMALWLALSLRFIGVDNYLKMWPRESNRLKQERYERLTERG